MGSYFDYNAKVCWQMMEYWHEYYTFWIKIASNYDKK